MAPKTINLPESLWNQFTDIAAKVYGKPYGCVAPAIKEALQDYIKKYGDKQ